MADEFLLMPYVNFTHIENYIGRDVAIVGDVRESNLKGLSFDLTTSDDQTVKIELTAPLDEPVFGFVEVSIQINFTSQKTYF